MLRSLPDEILREVYAYDSTYRDHFTKEVVPQLKRFCNCLIELLLMDHVPDARITPRLRSFSKYTKKAELVSLARYLGIVLPRKATKWRISLKILGNLTGREVPPPRTNQRRVVCVCVYR